MAPDDKTLDAVESPRNNNWFLLTFGCRRGITFLEQQAEVNPELIGVTGHSMGGKLTVDVASIDKRVAVAVPSCGGTGSARDILSGMPGAGGGREQSQLLLDTIDDVPYLKLLKCPTMFISPANDFAGPMDNMYINQRYVDNSFFYFAITPHRNHQHDEAFNVNTLLTFEQFLRKGFAYPKAPELTVNLKTEDGVPEVTLVADSSKPIEKVDIYYSVDPHVLTRFWRDAEAKKDGDAWVAKAPVMSTSHPLFFYANVTYKEDLSKFVKSRTRGKYKDQFALSSNLIRLTPEELKAAGVKAADQPERVVEDFSRGWHDWYLGNWDNPHHWVAATRKMKDPKYRPPLGAKLLLDVKIEEDNTLVFEFKCNTWGAYPHKPVGNFTVAKEVKGSPDWQTIEVLESDLLPSNFPKKKTDPLPEPQWRYVTEFELRCKGSVIRDGEKVDVSRPWQGGREFRNLRWEGGRYPRKIEVSGGLLDISGEELNSKISDAIDASWEGTEVFDGEPDAQGRVYLAISMTSEIDTFLGVKEDRSVGGKTKISVGGKTYERGLGVHAKSELVFPLDGEYATFHVVPGPDDVQSGQLEMKILVDGNEVFSSGLVSSRAYEPTPLVIPVSGAEELTLIVTEGGNGPGGDHASGADAYLKLAAKLEAGSGAASVILDVFPESVVQLPADQQDKTVMSGKYTLTDSSWGKHLDERTVFHHEIKHVQDEDNSFNLRIGKGGQLYSLRGAFGESIPPQSLESPWNDEVWQFVCVNLTYAHGLFSVELEGDVSEEVEERFKESPYAHSYFIHNSGAYIPNALDSGRITLSCDVLLDEKNPGKLEIRLRDAIKEPSKEFGIVTIETAGVSFGSEQVAPFQAGVWHNISLSFELGAEGRKRGILTVKGDGEEVAKEIELADQTFTAFNWLGLSAGGSSGLINIDNLSVKRVTDELTEWPIKEDFEACRVGLEYAQVPGQDKAKGSDSYVTDRIACSSGKSLEIRDGTDGWAPMVRVDVNTTIPRNLYCPLLGSDLPEDGRTYRTVNWGFVPQVRTVHRSPIMYYVQTRDVGNGVIEMTYVVHNFSARKDIFFKWQNAPWGGTRITSLPFHYGSTPEGKPTKEYENIIDVRKTGGWNLSCVSEDADSPSLALVYGLDKNLEAEQEKARKGLPHCQLEPTTYRDWSTLEGGRTNMPNLPENAWRNYDVAVVVPQFNLAPGVTIWYRSYLVVNRKDRTIELAKSLADKVDYGLLEFDPETTPKVPVELPGQDSFELFAHPVPGTMPLFLVENETTGQQVVTTDPYVFVPQEELDFGLPEEHPQADYYNQAIGYSLDENNTDWKRLLGYAYVDKPKTGSYKRISSFIGKSMLTKTNTFNLDLWVEDEKKQGKK